MKLKERFQGLEAKLDQFIVSKRGEYLFPGSTIIMEMAVNNTSDRDYLYAFFMESAKLFLATRILNIAMEAYCNYFY